MEDSPSVHRFEEISIEEFDFGKLSCLSEVIFSYFFLSSPLVWWCPRPVFPRACNFPFLKVFSFFSYLPVLFLLLLLFSNFSLSAWHFLRLNSITIYWLYIFIFCIRVSSSFSYFANTLLSSMYIKGLIFSWDFVIERHHCYYKK